MICYAIKNEDGKYLGNQGYMPSINYATLIYDFAIAKMLCSGNCKVVKVEIREVEDE